MHAIVTEKLTKRYGSRVGVENLDLQVSEGSVFGFLGPNGSGKSTTIRLLLALLRPSKGRAQIFGRDCWREDARVKEEVGYLAGDLRLYSWLTVEIGARIFGRVRGRDIRAESLRLAEQFDLDPEVRVRSMSRGRSVLPSAPNVTRSLNSV